MLRAASLCLIVGLLTDAHPSQAADWTASTPMPGARFGAATAGTATHLYFLGGFTDQTSAAVAAWDGTSWAQPSPMLEPRLMAGAATSGGLVYAIGGLDASGVATTTVERFDPAAGTWASAAPMPLARAAGAAGTIGGALFVAGGQADDGQPMAPVFRFDPATSQWTSLAAIPTPRSGVAGAVLADRLWVIGGLDGGPLATVERFDPASGSWSAGPDLPEPLWFPAAGVLDGRVWVVGGMDASFQRSDRAYSAGTDGVWRAEAVLPAAVAVASVGSLGDCLMVAGGMDGSGLPSAMAFSQCADAPPPPPPPPPPADTLQVAVTLSPATLNLGSQGQWISAHVNTGGWPASDIVVGSLRLEGAAPDMEAPIYVETTDLTVKFQRGAVGNRPAGDYVLTLLGSRADGTVFRGFAAITIQGSSLQSKRPLRPLAIGPSGVEVSLDQTSDVTIEVLDLQGRVVEHLHRGPMSAGELRIEWPRAGSSVARGVYFVRLKRGPTVDVVRLAVR